MAAEDRLRALGLSLPQVTPPAAAFVPFVRAGDIVFVSGHIAKRDGKPWAGRLGAPMTTEEGRLAARGVALDLLGTLRLAAGDLDRVARIVRLTVLVNSAPDFTEHHLVANGASELFQDVFGEIGRHARSAYGVAQIPFGSCVEIELIAQVREDPEPAASSV